MSIVITSDRKWTNVGQAQIVVTKDPEIHEFTGPFDDVPPVVIPNVGAQATAISGLEYRARVSGQASFADELPKFLFALKARRAPYVITLDVRLKDAPQAEIPDGFEFTAEMLEWK